MSCQGCTVPFGAARKQHRFGAAQPTPALRQHQAMAVPQKSRHGAHFAQDSKPQSRHEFTPQRRMQEPSRALSGAQLAEQLGALSARLAQREAEVEQLTASLHHLNARVEELEERGSSSSQQSMNEVKTRLDRLELQAKP